MRKTEPGQRGDGEEMRMRWFRVKHFDNGLKPNRFSTM